jgi:hypothetical protein
MAIEIPKFGSSTYLKLKKSMKANSTIPRNYIFSSTVLMNPPPSAASRLRDPS